MVSVEDTPRSATITSLDGGPPGGQPVGTRSRAERTSGARSTASFRSGAVPIKHGRVHDSPQARLSAAFRPGDRVGTGW